MKELIRILEVSVKKHGETTPITLGYLLNLTRMAEDIRQYEQEVAAIKEQNEHLDILETINPFGQD